MQAVTGAGIGCRRSGLDVCDNRAMPMGAGDPRRARMLPTEADRVRAANTIRRHGDEGLLSRREVEERIEETFR